MSNEADTPVSPVLHVVVVGFHHKKGCQVEYSYPPLIQGNPVDSHDVPEEWKHIASLAIPDGAHNYTKDTIYFHLPSRDGQHRTVYGVACYRQIDSSDLVNRTADVTRSTVQKSVCVLSRLPLYGLVQAKLELITHAYFDEKDFSKVELLEDTYKNLSQSMTESLLTGSQIFLGMSCRDVVVQFRHKIVLLFKLILLERRVLFTGAPVQKLCNTILALLALFPGMIEFGLEECASVGLNKQLSPTLHQTVSDGSNEDFLEVCYQDEKQENKIADDKEYTGQDGQKEKLHQLLQVQTESPSVVSCEPESPEIQRGSEPQTPHPLEKITLLTEQQNHGHTKTQNHSETSDIKLTDDQNLGESDLQAKRVDAIDKNVKKDNCDIHVDTTSEKVQTESRKKRSKVHRTLSESYGDLDDVQHGRTSSQSSVHSSCSIGPRGISEPSSTEPLADMKTITQIESVQTGKVMTTIDSVVNIEEISDTMGILDSIDDLSDSEKDRSRFDRSLNLDDSTEVLKRSGSIEELDSPESILKIDQEDCFSWEEDRLLLKIDHKDDAESNTIKENEGLGEVKKEIEGKDAVKPTLDLKLEISADDTKKDTVSQPSEGDVDKNSQTNDSGISTASEVGPSENSSKESSPEKEITKSPGRRTAAIKNRLSSALSGLKSRRLGSKTPSSEQEVEMEVVLKGGQLKTDDCGFPLAIFTKGCVCHPYLSLQFFDLLQDINVRGFVIGATNMLFTQKKHLSDVIIEVSDQGRIEFHDRELQRQLNLTTADLRFADVLVKAVSDEDKDDIYLDGTEWEGGEEWLQVQFKAYLKSLLMTLTQNDTKLLEDFGTSFTQAFRTTHCYRHWSGEDHSGMTDVPTGHPFRGNLAVGDIRMRLQHNLQNTERGKKINAAVVQTGKYVEQAGKAVGGAITNARSAVTSWFSSFSQKSDPNQTS